MIAVREFAFEQALLKITQRGRHALHALAEFDEVFLDELLAHARLEQPRQQMLEVVCRSPCLAHMS